MELEQQFVVSHPRDVVWDYFGRLDEVTRCMPGASLTEPPVDGRARFRLSAKLGPITAAFDGESDLERHPEEFRGVIRGAGRDNRTGSRAKGEVEYRLTEVAEGGTRVDIRVDFSLAGRLAQFGRAGIVNDLAGRMTAEFARNLESALAAESAPAATDPTSGADPSPGVPRPAAGPSAPPVAAGGLLFSVLWQRFRSWLAALGGRG